MAQNRNCSEVFWRSSGSRLFLLGLSWVAGLLLGAWAAFHSSADVFSLMLAAMNCRMSIVGVVLAYIFPLIVTGVAAFLSIPLLLPILAFLKAYLFGFSTCCISIVFGDAAWLMQFLFLFKDILTAIPLLWLWFRILCGNNHSINRVFPVIFICSMWIGYLDIAEISPIIAELFLQ